MAMNCAISGAMFSAIGAFGLFNPVTISLVNKTTFALVHEAIYGCGLGTVASYITRNLMGMIPVPPAVVDQPGGPRIHAAEPPP